MMMVGLELAADDTAAGKASVDNNNVATPASSSLFSGISLPFPRALSVNRS
jgi:hypothetical protein